MSLTPPVGPSGPRLSDKDRERVVEVLKTSCGDGRLTLDEFSERVDAAYRAISLGDLPPVLADLPHPFGSDLTDLLSSEAGRSPAPLAPPVPDTVGRQVTRWTVSIMGGSQRKGRWRLREKTNAVAVMGGIEIIVPEGIEVELGGIAIMGAKEARRVKQVPPIPGSPVIRVRAFAFWGGVSVRSRPVRASVGDGRSGGLPSPLTDGPGTGGDGVSREPRLIDLVAEEPGRAGDQLTAEALPDGTVTIMFSDIEGFTSITERLGDRRAMDVLREHNAIIRQRITGSGGHEIKAQGDGFMVAFSGASRALQCAVGIQRDFTARNRSKPDVPVQIRLGLHSGEAVRDGNDFMGGSVILAARITQQAKGGEILVSSVLKELCDLSGEFEFTDGRDLYLKGLSESRRVYSVTGAGTEDD